MVIIAEIAGGLSMFACYAIALLITDRLIS
jgi:hypothetical protein